jgi:alcohol dehydrogenase class IV
MRFEFATAPRIVFGVGTVAEAAPAARSFGKRALLVLGRSVARADRLLEQLQTEEVNVSLFHVNGEPTIETVAAGMVQARAKGCELVIGLGGGSPLDAGKAIAALLTNPGDIYDYLEVIGQGKALVHASVPYIAIPTTAGTGSEVTRNAVLVEKSHNTKVSLRGSTMLPRLAIVDPALTYDLPPEVTAGSGMDALTQLIEPFLSSAANPLTDAFCRDGLKRGAWALRSAYETGDHTARAEMALTSLLGGLALSNARLGAVHAFAGTIGGMFSAPHGALCARLLPVVMDVNLKAVRERAPQSATLGRFAELAQILTGNSQARPEDGIAWLYELSSALKIAPLTSYGVQKAFSLAVTAQAKRANSMKGNPIELMDAELNAILNAAL